MKDLEVLNSNKNMLKYKGRTRLQYYEKIQKVKNKIKRNIEKKVTEFTGIAYVSFEREAKLDGIVKNWRFSFTYKVFLYLKYMCCGDSEYFFEGQYISVEKATEPSDIYWENLHTSYFYSWK